MKNKKRLLDAIMILAGFCLNFFIFLAAYKKLAFPFLHEAQRVENAAFIFNYVLPSFVLASIFLLILYKYFNKR